MIVANGDSLGDLASSNNEEDVEDEDDEDSELGTLSEHDEPSWVLRAISNTIHLYTERFQQMQMNLDELTQPEGGNAADYFRERDI